MKTVCQIDELMVECQGLDGYYYADADKLTAVVAAKVEPHIQPPSLTRLAGARPPLKN